MAPETEYYVVCFRSNGNNKETHIREALNEKGLNPSSVHKIDDPSILPKNITEPPEEFPFEDAFQRILEDPEHPLFSILNALKDGGRASFADFEEKGIPRDSIEEVIGGVLHGHVFRDPKNPTILVCPRFTVPKDGC